MASDRDTEQKMVSSKKSEDNANPEYMNDKKVSYQLAVHVCVYVPFVMLYRSLGYRVVRQYSVEELLNKEQLISDMQRAMQAG